MDGKENARAYDEALERAKKLLATSVVYDRFTIEKIFPELKESEDERIRKDIIILVKDWWDRVTKDNISTKEQMLAWIKKQDGQKATTVWHDVSEVPDEMQELLVEWESPDATWHNIAFYDAATKAFRHLKQPINNVTRWAYVCDILTQSVTKTSDKEKGSEQIPANPEKIIKYEPKFKAGDKLISTKNPHLTYEIIDIEDNELGELDYKVIIYTDGKDGVTHNISCKNVDAWGELVKEKPAWSEEDEYMLNETIQHLEELIRIDKAKYLGCGVQYYQRDIDWLKSFRTRFVG